MTYLRVAVVTGGGPRVGDASLQLALCFFFEQRQHRTGGRGLAALRARSVVQLKTLLTVGMGPVIHVDEYYQLARVDKRSEVNAWHQNYSWRASGAKNVQSQRCIYARWVTRS